MGGLMRTILLLCLCGCASMPKTPQAIAEKSKCQPWEIAYYTHYSMDYVLTPVWEEAQTCLDRQTGDCKCFAVIAKESLDRCAGYESRILVLGNGKRRHAVTVFTDHKGQRGYINSLYYGVYPPSTEWETIAKDIQGNWKIAYWRGNE